jgi:plastocyanin
MKKAAFGLLLMIFLLAGFLLAQADDRVEIKMILKDNRFVPDEIRVQAGKSVTLSITNSDATAEEFESFALNREKLIPAGKTITIFLPKLQPGTYEFGGEFHPKTARGRLIVK